MTPKVPFKLILTRVSAVTRHVRCSHYAKMPHLISNKNVLHILLSPILFLQRILISADFYPSHWLSVKAAGHSTLLA